ncbi:glycosyltransferase family 4 protein [Billgrantia pellis]|nr:glycosyltransferase family 4 protein [Halomonas pellis]
MLWPFLAAGLFLQRGILRADFYAGQPHAGIVQRRFPRLHFLFRGAWRLHDPHPAFSQITLFRDFPRLRLQPPVLNHVLNPEAERDLPLHDPSLNRAWAAVDVITVEPEPQPRTEPEPGPVGPPQLVAASSAPPLRGQQLAALWPVIEEDGEALHRAVPTLIPTPRVREWRELGIAPPRPASREAQVVTALMDRFPDRVDHLVLLPWLGTDGGSERVAACYLSYLRARYPHERLCLFLPDEFHKYSPGGADRLGVLTVAINDLWPEADLPTRLRIYDRVITNLRPACVHNINSLVGWESLLKHGAHHALDSRLFVNLYSDVRLHREPLGYYHSHLPFVIEALAGVLCDNWTVARKAIDEYGLSRRQADKFFYVPTPMLGLNGGDPRREVRTYRPPVLSGHALWMSRVAPEKRLDVLNAIARLRPARQISMYGAILEGLSPAADLTLLDEPNIDYHGRFDTLDDLPLETFDAYLFTSDCEGMPIALLEAVKLGLPVIAPDVGGIGEMIDQDTGWLVSHGGAVEDYLRALDEIEAHPEEAARRVARAQQRLMERHSLASFMDTLESIPGYLQVADQ